MTRLRLLTTALVGFSLLSAAAVWRHGYFGVWAAGFRDLASFQILVDLSLACLLVTSWLARDARERGRAAGPWLVGTLLTGSLAPLLYMVLRERERARGA